MEERSYTIKNQKLKGTWVIYIYGIAFVLLALKYLYAAVLFALAAVAITTKYKMDNENKSAMCVNLAIKYVAAGKIKEAKEYLQWAIEHNKLNKDAYLFYGSILFDEQDYTNALEYFKLGGIDKIEDPKVAGILGECYFDKENYDLAIKYLEMIEYPENSDFEKKRLYTIGRAYSEAKMYEKSLNALNKVPRELCYMPNVMNEDVVTWWKILKNGYIELFLSLAFVYLGTVPIIYGIFIRRNNKL